MDRTLLMEAMKASISEVLETMYFMVIDDVSDSEKKVTLPVGCNAVGVVIRFDGPARGCFRLMVPSVLAHAISADFMGVDTDALDETDVYQTLTEMINMLAGNTLSLYDVDMVFDLSIPQIIGDDDLACNGRRQAGYCCLDIRTLDDQMIMEAEYEIRD